MFKTWTLGKNGHLGINVSIKESVLPIRKINCLLNMVKICLGVVKNCPFIGRRVIYFQIKVGKYCLKLTLWCSEWWTPNSNTIWFSCKNNVNTRKWIFQDVTGMFDYLKKSNWEVRLIDGWSVTLWPFVWFRIELTNGSGEKRIAIQGVMQIYFEVCQEVMKLILRLPRSSIKMK